jgi:hypothetical protein
MKSFKNWMEEQSGNLSVEEIKQLADGVVSTAFDEMHGKEGNPYDEPEYPYDSLSNALDSANQNGKDTIMELGGNKTDQSIFDVAFSEARTKYLYEYRRNNFVKAYHKEMSRD